MFKLEFDTDNDAFGNDPSNETASILRELADVIASGHRSGVARDRNGNTVGTFELAID